MATLAPGGQATRTKIADIPAKVGRVYLGDEMSPFLICNRLELRRGVMPARAWLTMCGNPDSQFTGTNAMDGIGPQTLNRYSTLPKLGQRVRIQIDGDVAFNGMVSRRRDSGQLDQVLLECVDDRILLQFMPIRGAFVYDPGEGIIKFIPGYKAIFNPNGEDNCRISQVSSTMWAPVFTHAAKGSNIQVGTRVSNTGTKNAIVPWTPLRILSYLNLLANLDGSAFEDSWSERTGGATTAWRSIAKSERLEWRYSMDFGGGGLSEDAHKKVKEVSIHGQTMAAAIDTACKLAGPLDLNVDYGNMGQNKKTRLILEKTVGSSAVGGSDYGVHLSLQRGGVADDAAGLVDFELDESIEDAVFSVLTEGASIKCEADLVYDPANVSTSTLGKGWTTSEEDTWNKIVNGRDKSGVKYALRPNKIPTDGTWSTADADYTIMDGTGGNPAILANSMSAVNLARQYLPRVWRSLKLNATQIFNLKINEGPKGEFKNSQFLRVGREILTTQLQSYISPSDNTSVLKTRVPVTISINGKPVMSNDGLMIDADGTIYFTGLTEEASNGDDLLYSGSIRLSPQNALLRHIRINAAFPLDIRASGLAVSCSGMVDSKYLSDLSGPPLGYVDAGESLVSEYQLGSRPMPGVALVPSTANDGKFDEVPVTRFLRDERREALHSSERKLKENQQGILKSQFTLPGISLAYKPGMLISSIKMVGSGESDYILGGASVSSVLYDFEAQTITLGGLISYK